MSLLATITKLRASAAAIAGFQKKYIDDDDVADKLFEFAAMLDLVTDLQKSGAGAATVRLGKKGQFARAPALRPNYNWIEQGNFRLDFGTQFTGWSTEDHAPDVSLTHKADPDRIVLAIECKAHDVATTDKGDVMAFVAVLLDLGRPAFPDSNGNDVVPGSHRATHVVINAPGDADVLRAARGDGRSYLRVFAPHAPSSHHKIALQYGFQIESKTLP